MFSALFGTKSRAADSLQTLGGELEVKDYRSSDAHCVEKAETVGGQAVIEGVMMRSKDHYALVMRLPNGKILAERKKWYTFTTSPLYKKAFLRGFPTLVETMINGVKTLNRSAEVSSLEDEKPLTQGQLVITMFFALAMAIGLFIILPHVLSYFMQRLGISGGVESFSFQVWDGLFKFLIFFLYLFFIGLLPDVKRVFQFHGAEHKVIAAYEQNTKVIDLDLVRKQNRLHPRCGTTFMLFVLTLAIIIHTIVLPPLLNLYAPESSITTHIVTVFIKILLIVPVSALAYELIRYASKLDSFIGKILKAPGLFLQLFTTFEPQDEHLEVALVSLKVALGDETDREIITPNYTLSK